MSRLASVFAGLFIVSSLSGCCLHGQGGYAPYGGSGGACGCAAQSTGYPSAMYTPGLQQTAMAQPAPYMSGQTAFGQPQTYGGQMMNTAMLDASPTY